MNDDARKEVLKKRLIGALVLLAALLLLTFLLPQPGEPPPLEPGEKRVTVDLLASPAPVASEPAPVETPAPVPAAEPDQGTEAAVAAAEPETAPAPAEAAPTPAPAPMPKPTGPTLKLDSKLSKLEPPAPKLAEPAPVVAAEKPKPAEAVKPAPPAKAELKPEPAKPAPSAPKTPPGEKPWYVQLGSFSSVDNARQLLDRLRPAGYGGLISPAETKVGTLYRARVGPYASRAAAEAARDKLAGQGLKDSKIVQD